LISKLLEEIAYDPEKMLLIIHQENGFCAAMIVQNVIFPISSSSAGVFLDSIDWKY
jgi:hypothetical protein